MEGKRLIRKLSLRNFLSFGDEFHGVDLEPLNVLIGPNGSGKSNLIEALSVLRATPKDLTAPIRDGGGIEEWIWKGVKGDDIAQIVAFVSYDGQEFDLRHLVQLRKNTARLDLFHEDISDFKEGDNTYKSRFLYYYDRRKGGGVERQVSDGEKLSVHWEGLKGDQSILSQVRDPERFPELTYLSRQYEAVKIYRIPTVGGSRDLRRPQPTDLSPDFLEEDGSNLGLVVNNLVDRGMKPAILGFLKRFSDSFSDLTAKIFGNTILLNLHEQGLARPVPITRLSDGTVNYLCLLAILCHPDPPPLICIEEPEVGLHPDIIPTVAELLVEASQRAQLVVTTHSTALVTALSDTPEAIVVCDRDPDGSRLRRLDPARMEKWLEEYTLGDLWEMGEIGGNRW
jgi:predicted ATPase